MLVGFQSNNHPQQTGRRGPADDVDDRGTDPEFFARMVERFGDFDLDVAAAAHNAKCERYFTLADDGLTHEWKAELVWCNPPYSDIRPWVVKAWAEHAAGRAREIVMLLPANRTEQGWWQDEVEPYRDGNFPLRVEFLRGRLRFDRPGWTPGPRGNRPPFGNCLLVWGGRR